MPNMAYVLLIDNSKLRRNRCFIQGELVMPDRVLEQCRGYDLLENLSIKNRTATNHDGLQVSDIRALKSDAEDEEWGEEEIIPFLDLLQKQGIDPKVQARHDLQKAKGSASTSHRGESFQENEKAEYPLEIPGTSIQGIPYMGKNSDASPSSIEIFNDFSTVTQKSQIGVEQNYSRNQMVNTSHPATLLPTFFRGLEGGSHDPTQKQLLGITKVDANTRLNVDSYFISPGGNNNFATYSLFPGNRPKGGVQQDEEAFMINDSGIFSKTEPTSGNLATEITRKQSDTGEGSLFKDHHTLLNTGQAIFDATQASGFPGSDTNEINVRELPAPFRSQSQHVSPENTNTPFVPEVNVLTNMAEKQMKNEVSQINGDTAPQQNSYAGRQADKEGDLAGNFSQGHGNTSHAFLGAQAQKSFTRRFLAVDAQSVANGTQTSITNSLQNTETITGIWPKQGSPADALINSEIHAFHSSISAGEGHLHGSIMEQLIQKFNLVSHGDRSEIKLHLTPPELGSIKIHFTDENDEISAQLFVEDAEVKAAIENNVHRLKESMAASGLEIQKMEVFIQNAKTDKEKFSENFETKNQQQYQAKSQGSSNRDQGERENDTGGARKKGFGGTAKNLLVDYII